MTSTGGATIEIAEGTYEVKAPFWGFPLSLYFLESGGRWAVVDTGISSTPEQHIVPFMASRGGLQALELVLLTHGHVDHIGGNAALRELAPHVRFAIHEADLGWAESLERHLAVLYAYGEPDAWRPDAEMEQSLREACGAPVAIDHILADGDTVSFGAGRALEVSHIGGHSPGHVLLRDRLTGAVFSGDALQGSGALNRETGKRDFPMYRTVRDYLAGLERVERLQPSVLCTAHIGAIPAAEVAAAVGVSAGWTEGFDALMRTILAEAGTLNLSGAVAAVSQARSEHAVLLQMHVTVAEHLNEMVRVGLACPSMREGVKHWTWTGADKPAADRLQEVAGT